MKTPPAIISSILFLISGATAFWIACSGTIGLSKAEIVQAEIALFATFGALISATFVVYSYLQTNMAFLEGKRPQLLIQVKNGKLPRSESDPEQVPVSFIEYKNFTQNQFTDLNIYLTVLSANRTIDISDLFENNMNMTGLDSRVMHFEPVELLSKKRFRYRKIIDFWK